MLVVFELSGLHRCFDSLSLSNLLEQDAAGDVQTRALQKSR